MTTYDHGRVKVKCAYCNQRQNAENKDCKFCGAPLPAELFGSKAYIDQLIIYKNDFSTSTLQAKQGDD